MNSRQAADLLDSFRHAHNSRLIGVCVRPLLRQRLHARFEKNEEARRRKCGVSPQREDRLTPQRCTLCAAKLIIFRMVVRPLMS